MNQQDVIRNIQFRLDALQHNQAQLAAQITSLEEKTQRALVDLSVEIERLHNAFVAGEQ